MIEIFDRKRLAQNLRRTQQKISNHDFLLRWTERELSARLSDIKRSFDTGVHIGKTKFQNFPKLGLSSDSDIIADEECLPLAPASLDLITSTLALHNVNDLPGTLLQIRQTLKPDGLFLAAMLGGETLHELRASLTQAELKTSGGASPRIHPFADKQQMGALLQRAGFNLPVVDSEILTVTYDSIFKLLHDLRGMGEGNIIAERKRTNPGKALFMEAAKHYAANFAEPDGRIVASFEIIFLCGWAPHESQQKPLTPGSAKTRLADALGGTEEKL